MEGLEDSTDELQHIVSTIRSVIDDDATYGPSYAPVFYLLDQFNDDLARKYTRQWTEGEIHPQSYSDGGDCFAYLAKSHTKYSETSILEEIKDKEILERFKNNQMRSGRIPEFHGPALRGLVAIAPDSDVTQAAIEHVVERHADQRLYNTIDKRIHHESLMALLELNYAKYKNIILQGSDHLLSRVPNRQDEIEEAVGAYVPGIVALYHFVPDLEPNPTVGTLVDASYSDFNQWAKHSPDDSWASLPYYAKIGIGLLAAGQGPNVPRYKVEWYKQIERQDTERSKPQFVCTYPASSVGTRRLEIRNTLKSMIKRTNKTLRISSLRIDMLHEPIFDLAESGGIDIRMLTSAGKEDGSGNKMKRAVMQEMIRRTDGQVKEGDLVHSRMAIVDDEELLISTADMTRDQLHDEFNVGIYTRGNESVKQAIEYFDSVWNRSEYRG